MNVRLCDDKWTLLGQLAIVCHCFTNTNERQQNRVQILQGIRLLSVPGVVCACTDTHPAGMRSDICFGTETIGKL